MYMVSESLWDDGVIDRLSPSDHAFFKVLREESVDVLFKFLASRRRDAGFHGQLDEGLAREYACAWAMLEDKHGLTPEDIQTGMKGATPMTDQEEREFVNKQIQVLKTLSDKINIA